MNNPRLTIVLLILIVMAAMWTSGRLTALSNAILGKVAAGGSAGGAAKLSGGSANAKQK
jgi:hypothetical protein